MIARDQLIEIDFDRVNPDPIHPFYGARGEPVRVPLYAPVIALSPHRCTDCGNDSEPQRGLIAWLALRDNPQTPTQWITLCEEHFEKTSRKKPELA